MYLNRNTSTPRSSVSSGLQLLLALGYFFAFCQCVAAAQGRAITAQVTKTSPGVVFYDVLQGRRGSFTPKPGDAVQPGTVIDTGPGGRVVLALGDGSQVTIYERSRVELKDFRGAGTWRDLLEVTLGRVRATINHQGKRPNPYRVFSPIASIAVRGTDFFVIVESNLETRVLVFEGLVEVASLVNPQKPTLVRPGRNVVVRPDGDISLSTASPRGELNEIRSLRAGNRLDNNLSEAFNSHQDNLIDFRPSRFAAYSDSHLDSLQNPAYAGEFRAPNGRFSLLPSFSPSKEIYYSLDFTTFQNRLTGISSANYTAASQVSYFAPVGKRTVIGGGLVVTKTDLGGDQIEGPYTALQLRRMLSADEIAGRYLPPDPPGAVNLPEVGNYAREETGHAKFTTADLTLALARRLGKTERTSIGVKFDYQEDRSSFSVDSNWTTRTDFSQYKTATPARRKGFTAGLTRAFGENGKLGVYYRYNTGSLQNRIHYFKRFITIELKPFFALSDNFDLTTRQAMHFSEAGIRYRGAVRRRLIYGLEGGFIDEQRRLRYRHVQNLTTGESGYQTQSTQTSGGILGAGLGLLLPRRTALSIDASAGVSRERFGTSSQNPPGTTTSEAFGKRTITFRALHFGGQTDLKWNLFAGGSRILLRENDRRRQWSVYEGKTFFDSLISRNEPARFSTLSLGWRMRPGWIAQYTYFTSHGPNAPSHSLLFRHEFGRREDD